MGILLFSFWHKGHNILDSMVGGVLVAYGMVDISYSTSILAFVIIRSSYSYILLTANMEDVHALARQLATSPVVHEIGKMWRRASSQFRRQIARDARRHGDSDTDGESKETEEDRNMRRIVKNLIALAKDTGYLGPMKRAFEIIKPKIELNK